MYVPEDVPAGMRTTNVALAAAPPGMSPIICGSDSTAMPLVPTRPTVTDLAVFGRSVRSTTVEPTIFDSMRPEFWMTTFNGTVWPAGTSFDPAIEAESSGPPDVYFAPAATGDAMRAATRSAATAHPIAVRRIPLVGMRTDSDTICPYTNDIRIFN